MVVTHTHILHTILKKYNKLLLVSVKIAAIVLQGVTLNRDQIHSWSGLRLSVLSYLDRMAEQKKAATKAKKEEEKRTGWKGGLRYTDSWHGHSWRHGGAGFAVQVHCHGVCVPK